MATRKTPAKPKAVRRAKPAAKKEATRAMRTSNWAKLKTFNKAISAAATKLAAATSALAQQDPKFGDLNQAAQAFSAAYQSLVQRGPGGAEQVGDHTGGG